jgi:hypothetical protein
MTKLLALLVGSIAGTIGWWLGAKIGLITAFVLALIATGSGMYYATKWARENMPE